MTVIDDFRRPHPEYSATAHVLFGSWARGDQSPESDVDILLVTEQKLGHQAGPLSLFGYTSESLRALAAHGSLFLLHLRLEGIVLWEARAGTFSEIVDAYVAPDYQLMMAELRLGVAAFFVDEVGYMAHWHGFNQAMANAVRTAAYLRCAQLSTPTFNMERVANILGMPGLQFTSHLARASEPDFAGFLAFLDLLVGLTGASVGSPSELSDLFMATQGNAPAMKVLKRVRQLSRSEAYV